MEEILYIVTMEFNSTVELTFLLNHFLIYSPIESVL